MSSVELMNLQVDKSMKVEKGKREKGKVRKRE